MSTIKIKIINIIQYICTFVVYKYTNRLISNYINVLCDCKNIQFNSTDTLEHSNENVIPFKTNTGCGCVIDFLPDTVESLEIPLNSPISDVQPIYMPKNLLVLKIYLNDYKQPLNIPKKL